MKKKTIVFNLLVVSLFISSLSSSAQLVGSKFVVPVNPRAQFSMNPGWKFIKQDVAGADGMNIDDSKWETVSTPHTYNDIDTYDEIISRGGEKSEYMGIAWYRKHFKIPAGYAGNKVFIEFEGMKQAGRFWVNGKFVRDHWGFADVVHLRHHGLRRAGQNRELGRGC